MLQRDRALATIVLSVDPTLLYLLVADPENPVGRSSPEEDMGQQIKPTKKVVQFEAER